MQLGSIELPMAKKKQPAPGRPKNPDPHKDQQINLRIEPALLEAVDVYAERVRRSRNNTIVVILEEVLTQAGLWPPKAAPSA
jgi:hypothetical protein